MKSLFEESKRLFFCCYFILQPPKSLLQKSQHDKFLHQLESPVAQWLEHPTRSQRVVGSNPIWSSDFFFPSF